jgi:hypothetical protein
MFLKKINIVWLMLTLFLPTEENSAFRGEDLEEVACKPIRNTLRFARLR